MKLPLMWLREFVNVDASVEEIARRLSVAGLEVENVERLTPGFEGVTIARVLDVQKHPNADRLHLCQVDSGSEKFSIVCGAPNVQAGMTAALARVGAKLGKEAPLQAAVIRGVRSEGMLCSERELGLSTEHAGILSLPLDAPLGTPLADYLGLNETVFDVAVLANRGDCLSIVGLAREVAALFGSQLTQARAKSLKAAGANAPFGVEMAAHDLCPRYAALKMTGIKIGPSPMWMKRRLELCGTRSINNVVDATNYVMLELGQPLHAFDLTQIAGAKIVVRRAGPDREFVTLDDQKRELRPDDLLICDPEKPLAIAGIMGGQNSEVSDSTTTILLESAYFEPMTVARSARRLGLRSEASYRFERGVDRMGQVAALYRVAELLRQIASAREEGGVGDHEVRPMTPREIALDPKKLAALLGVEIPAPEVRRRLIALGASVKKSAAGKNILRVVPPSYRSDLNEPADLAEEVARLTGLEDVPAALPSRKFAYAPPNRDRDFIRGIREILLGAGFSELDTLAFATTTSNEKFAGVAKGEPIRVHNPIVEEMRQMRRSLLPAQLEALRFNLNHQAADFHAFEIAKVYSREGDAPLEQYALAALSYAEYARGEVGKPAVKAGFFTMKGVVEALMAALGLTSRISYRAPSDSAPGFLHPGASAQIFLDDDIIGYLGELHPREAMERDLSEPCVVCELDLEKLRAYGFSPHRTIEAPPRFPAVRRDLALVLDRSVPAAAALATIRELGGELLEDVSVFDVYEGQSVASGKKSVALALRYRAKERTLTDDEVNRVHAALVEAARSRLGAELRQ